MSNPTFPLAALLAAALLPVSATAAEPLTAERAVAAAAQRNPALQAAALDAASAAWEVVGEEGRYPFSLLADAEASRTSTPSLVAVDGLDGIAVGETDRVGGGVQIGKHLLWGTDLTLRVEGGGTTSRADNTDEIGPAWDMAARFSVVQPLLRGAGRSINEAPLVAARARKTRADLSRDRQASQTVNTVLSAYWELWYAEQSLAIARDALATAERSRDDAVARVRTGSLAPVEALSFETRVSTRREEVATAEALQVSRSAALAAVMGMAGADPGSPAEERPPEPAPVPGRTEAALALSPELAEARAAVEVARAAAIDAGEASRARVDLEAWAETRRLGNETWPLASAPRADGGYGAGLGLVVELPLDTRQNRSARARANLAVESAEREVERIRQDVLSSVTSLEAESAAARRRVDLTAATLDAAERQLAGQRTRFGTGNATALEVLEAEDEVRSARLREARSRVDLFLAESSLEGLTGELVSRYAVASSNGASDGG